MQAFNERGWPHNNWRTRRHFLSVRTTEFGLFVCVILRTRGRNEIWPAGGNFAPSKLVRYLSRFVDFPGSSTIWFGEMRRMLCVQLWSWEWLEEITKSMTWCCLRSETRIKCLTSKCGKYHILEKRRDIVHYLTTSSCMNVNERRPWNSLVTNFTLSSFEDIWMSVRRKTVISLTHRGRCNLALDH